MRFCPEFVTKIHKIDHHFTQLHQDFMHYFDEIDAELFILLIVVGGEMRVNLLSFVVVGEIW